MKMLFWNVPNFPARSVVTWNEPDAPASSFHGNTGSFGVVQPHDARTLLIVTSVGPVFVTEKSNSAVRSPGFALYSLVIASKTRLVETARAWGTNRAIPASTTSHKARNLAIRKRLNPSRSKAPTQTDF